MNSSATKSGTRKIETTKYSLWQLHFYAMAAEECVPFIPEIGTPSSDSSTCRDDDSTTFSDAIDTEKGGRDQDDYYSRVVLEDFSSLSQNGGPVGFRARLTASRRNLALAFLTLLALGIFITVFMLAIRTSSKKTVAPDRIPGLDYTSDGRLLSCGNTFEEAEAAGCKFDIMTFVYTPPACYDEEAALDAINDNSALAPSRAAGTWPWWRYENHTEPLPQTIEDLSSFIPVWTNNVYHRAHCLYLWRVSLRAMTKVASSPPGGVWVYTLMFDWAHVSHCNRLLTNMEKPENAPVSAVKKIGSCVRLDGSSEAAAGAKGFFGLGFSR